MSAVKHITATDDAMDPIPSTLRTYNAKLTKEEVEADNLRVRLRGLRPQGGDDDSSAGLPKLPGPKVPAKAAEVKGVLAGPEQK